MQRYIYTFVVGDGIREELHAFIHVHSIHAECHVVEGSIILSAASLLFTVANLHRHAFSSATDFVNAVAAK